MLDRVFISYSLGEDATTVKAYLSELSAALKQEGFEVRHDEGDLDRTAPVRESVFRLVNTSDAVVFLATPESLQSRWCMLEVGAALSRDKPVVAVLKGGAHRKDLPDPLKEYSTDDNFVQAARDLRGRMLDSLGQRVEGDVAHELRRKPRVVYLGVGSEWRSEDHGENVLLLGQVVADLAERYRARVSLEVVSVSDDPAHAESALAVLRDRLGDTGNVLAQEITPWKRVDPRSVDTVTSVATNPAEWEKLAALERRRGVPWIWLSQHEHTKIEPGRLAPTAAALSEWGFLALRRFREGKGETARSRRQRVLFRVMRSALLAEVAPLDLRTGRTILTELWRQFGILTPLAYPLWVQALAVVTGLIVVVLSGLLYEATLSPRSAVWTNLGGAASTAFVPSSHPAVREGEWHAYYFDAEGRRLRAPSGDLYPAEVVELDVTSASVWTKHRDPVRGRTYFGMGRASAEGAVTLTYFSEQDPGYRDLENLVGTVLVGPVRPATEQGDQLRCGHWAGRVALGGVRRGFVLWVDHPHPEPAVGALFDRCEFDLRLHDQVAYLDAIRQASRHTRDQDPVELVFGEIDQATKLRYPSRGSRIDAFDVQVFHYAPGACPSLSRTASRQASDEELTSSFPCDGELPDVPATTCAYYTEAPVSREVTGAALEDPFVLASPYEPEGLCGWPADRSDGDAACARFGARGAPGSGVLCVSTRLPDLRFDEEDRLMVAALAASLEPWLEQLDSGRPATAPQAPAESDEQ